MTYTVVVAVGTYRGSTFIPSHAPAILAQPSVTFAMRGVGVSHRDKSAQIVVDFFLFSSIESLRNKHLRLSTDQGSPPCLGVAHVGLRNDIIPSWLRQQWRRGAILDKVGT